MSDAGRRLKVAIIGGGASGWSAAEALRHDRWSGRFDVTLYEKNSYFGGKCCTVFPDGRICNGEPGGYELGASVLSKGSRSNADLEALLQRHRIPYSNAAEAERNKYRFYVAGRVVDLKYLLGRMVRRPLRFMRALYGIVKYWFDLWDYSRMPQLDYHGRPEELNSTLSSAFPAEFNLCCGFGMQGFGYAHLDDPALTPPMLYYHQYAPGDVIVNPVYTIDIGMQGIWARVASTYANDKARLNEEVIGVKRQADGVQLTTSQGTARYDYLVVAVPLGAGLGFMDFDAAEAELLSRVQCNHYLTVLCRVSGLTDTGNVNVLKTVDRDALGCVVFAYKRYPDSDWVSLNLYADPNRERSDDEILDRVEQNLRDDFAAELIERSSARIYHWRDYFPHLGTAALNDRWYQKFDETIQAQRRTLFVSSGLHMETVGASVQYATAKVNEVAEQWLARG